MSNTKTVIKTSDFQPTAFPHENNCFGTLIHCKIKLWELWETDKQPKKFNIDQVIQWYLIKKMDPSNCWTSNSKSLQPICENIELSKFREKYFSI